MTIDNSDPGDLSTETAGVARGSPPAPKVRLGPYRLLERLGEGGMGEVWLCEQTEPIRRRVAIKVIRPGFDTERIIARFEAERQALALMEHPAVASVFDAGSTPEGRPYFAMEYVAGEPITSYCDRHRLAVAERLELFQKICDGVQHAHHKGIIHRDLKPSNVLVTLKNETPQPKIIDFGVAKAAQTQQRLTERTLYTEFGTLIGTPEYMSPEQAEAGGLDIDTRTDVYALGVILYELLAGVLPFDLRELRELSLDEVRRVIREEEPTQPSDRVSGQDARSSRVAMCRRADPAKLVGVLKGDLDWITMKALEKDRTRRYASPAELAADIERYLRHEAVEARPPTLIYRTRKFIRRHRAGTTAAALILLGLIVFGGSMAWQAHRIAIERDRAEWVSRFLVSLFLAPDPSEARGQPLSARDLLDRGAARIESELKGDPVLQARVMLMLGRTYEGLGAYEQAEPLLRRALSIQRERLGPDHHETIASLHNLALVCWDLGRYSEAETLYREAIEHGRRSLGESDPQTLTSTANLANTLLIVGRIAEAEELLQTVLEQRRKVRGPDHLETLSTSIDLALVHERQGKYVEAKREIRETLEGMKRALGEDHPETIKAKYNLALLLNRLRRYAEADALYGETLAGMQRVLGEVHPHTLMCMAALAMNRANDGRYDEAEIALREALELQRQAIGASHPETLNSLYNLACISALKGDTAAALTRLGEAIDAGYANAEWMLRDTDLESVRGNPEFDALVARARQNRPG